MIITLQDILRAERDRRNTTYPRLITAGQLTRDEANQRWARFNTLLEWGGVASDMARKFYTSLPDALEEYRRWIREELALDRRNAPAVAILESWLRGIAGPPREEVKAPKPDAKQTSLFEKQ